MSPLPTDRTTANTPAEHVSDHNTAHGILNALNGTYVGYVADATGVAATDTAALQAAIDAVDTAAVNLTDRTIYLRGSGYVVNTSLLVGGRGVALVGAGEHSGTIIYFSGTGSLFELGTDSGNPHDQAEYDGVGNGFRLENISLRTLSPATSLANGLGNYTVGTTAVKDWRGGDIVFRNVEILGFDYPFWGIQSDLNRWDHVRTVQCHSGVYMGPRSDQWTNTAFEAIYCDRALDLDRVHGARITGQFISCGTDTVLPIKVHSAWSVGCQGISFDDCWFEAFGGYAAAAQPAFVEIGVGDAVLSENIHFRNPTILTAASPTLPRTTYLVRVGNGDAVSIENPNGQFWGNLSKLIEFVGTTSGHAYVTLKHPATQAIIGHVNSGSGSPSSTFVQWGGLGIAGGIDFTGASVFVDNLAVDTGLTLGDAVNVAAGTTTGSKIGTATTQKLGFFNATPVVQEAGSNDVLASLVTLGLRAASSNPPLNLGSGALTAGTVTVADGSNVVVGSTTGTKIGTATSQKLGFFNATPIVQPTGATDLRTALINLGLYASGGASPLNLNGGSLIAAGASVSTGAATALFQFSASTGQSRDINIQTSGSARWIIRVDSTAEAGSDVGSDFNIMSRTDAGGAKAVILKIVRSTGVITLGGELVTLASATGLAGLNLPHGAAPSSPVNGDMWTTTAGLFVRINGATVGPLS